MRLNAAGTGTDAILKSVLLGPDGSPSERVKAYADTETGRIFFGDRERRRVWHGATRGLPLVQRSGSEGAKAVQEHALEYLRRARALRTWTS